MKSQTDIMGVPGASSLSHAIALEAVDKLRDTYLPWLDRALAQIDHTILWQRPRKGVNSIGNLLLHLNGNIRQWILHGLGGEEDHRDRDGEFSANEGAEADILFAAVRETVEHVCEVILTERTDEEWLRPLTIQGFSTTPLAAVIHVTEHFAYHTGQIVLLVKSASGVDLGFYDLD